jgi:hypothetical protein
MSERTRQPKGVPVGGQFAATAHNEPSLTLATPTPAALPELEPYGHIPAPLENQTLENGEPAAATFEDSYREYFRPLDEYEAVHGPFTAQPTISEGEIQGLAGLAGMNLGRERGTSLARDPDSGEPVIIVSTRNGGYYADCYEDNCDGSCPGCIQTDVIPELPTYLRSEHEGGDTENYFRAADPAAGLAAIEAQETRERLHRLNYDRTAIAAGKQPPWVILSPVRDMAARDQLRRSAQKLREQASYRTRDRRHAEAVRAAIRDGVPLPSAGLLRVPSE